MSEIDRLIRKYSSKYPENELIRFIENQQKIEIDRFVFNEAYFENKLTEYFNQEVRNSQKKSSIENGVMDTESSFNFESQRFNFSEKKMTFKSKIEEIDFSFRSLNGLVNYGKSFYFNALIQVLFHSEKFRFYLDDLFYNEDLLKRVSLNLKDNKNANTEKDIVIELTNLFTKLRNPKKEEIRTLALFTLLFPTPSSKEVGYKYLDLIVKTIADSIYSIHQIAEGTSTVDISVLRNENLLSKTPGMFPKKENVFENPKKPEEIFQNILHGSGRKVLNGAKCQEVYDIFRSVLIRENFQDGTEDKEEIFSIKIHSGEKTLENGLDRFFNPKTPCLDDTIATPNEDLRIKYIDFASEYLVIEVIRDNMIKENGNFREKIENDFTFEKYLYVDQYLYKNRAEIVEIRKKCSEKRDSVLKNKQFLDMFEQFGDHKLHLLKVLFTMQHFCKEVSSKKYKDSLLQSSFFAGKLSSTEFRKAYNELNDAYIEKVKTRNEDLIFIKSAFDQLNRVKYNLYAIIMQIGPQDNLHFYCYIKIRQNWVLLNDSKIYEISESEVLHDAYGKRSQNSGSKFLFYEKEYRFSTEKKKPDLNVLNNSNLKK